MLAARGPCLVTTVYFIRMRTKRKILAACAAATLALLPCAFAPGAAAAEYNPGHIISDAEMRDAHSMDLGGISAFLSSKGGLGAQFDVDPVDGLLKSAPQLIYDAARRYQVNPKYVMALLQKESSAVETAKPTKRQLDWAAGYALCDGCNRGGWPAQKYKGLAKQIDAGAGWMDWYLRNAATLASLRQAGDAVNLGDAVVTPDNLATAALYSYTPHAHGNRLLWSIMQRWFGGGDDLALPDGAIVRNERTGVVAVIQGGRLRPIKNRSVLLTRFNATNIVDLNEYDFTALADRSAGPPVRFADLSLVRTEAGVTYLLVGDVKRRVASPDAFRAIGFNPEEVEEVAVADLDDYADGAAILGEEQYPLGRLLQDKTTGGVWFAQAGRKHAVIDRAILVSNFPGGQISPATPAALDAIAPGDPVRFVEGTLVKTKTEATVYLISGGKKRPFPAEKEFLAFGYSFKNVLTASPRALALHGTGPMLAIAAPASDAAASRTAE